MTTTILAHFDGTVIVPDEPLPFLPGEKVRVTIERESKAIAATPASRWLEG